MNVGRKQLVEQNPKLSQTVLEVLDSVKFINIKENATNMDQCIRTEITKYI